MPDNNGYESYHKHNSEEHPGTNKNRQEIDCAHMYRSITFHYSFQTNKPNQKRTREERDNIKEEGM